MGFFFFNPRLLKIFSQYGLSMTTARIAPNHCLIKIVTSDLRIVVVGADVYFQITKG